MAGIDDRRQLALQQSGQHVEVGDGSEINALLFNHRGIDPRIKAGAKIQKLATDRSAEGSDAVTVGMLAMLVAAMHVEQGNAIPLQAAVLQRMTLYGGTIRRRQMHGIGNQHHGGFRFRQQAVDAGAQFAGIEPVPVMTGRYDITRTAAVLKIQQHAVIQDVRGIFAPQFVGLAVPADAVGHRKSPAIPAPSAAGAASAWIENLLGGGPP